LLIATRLRRSELVGLRWIDYEEESRTLAVAGTVIRVAAEGLKRIDETKSAASRRILPLPEFSREVDGASPAAVCR